MTAFKKLSVIFVLMVVGATAVAADISRGTTVTSRARPDYDADGMPAGGFRLFPSLGVDLISDDNIRPTPADVAVFGKLDDIILLVSPALELRSDWSRNEVNLGLEGRLGRYDEYDREDFNDYKYWADGRFDLPSNSWVFAKVQHEQLHVPRTSPNDEDGLTKPTVYDVDNLTLRLRYAPSRLYAELGVEVDVVDFDDTTRLIGAPISNEYRDRTMVDSRLRLGYQVSPGYSMFAEGRVYDIDYDILDATGLVPFNRDSDGLDLIGGAAIDISGVTFGEVFFGYRKFDYADPQFETQDGPVFGANLDWNVTQLTTLNFTASQRIFGTTVTELGKPASGIEAVELGVRADHELLRNLLLNISYQNVNEDFLNITRKDDVQRFETGFVYMMGKNLELNGGYVYQKRTSNIPTGLHFKINQIFVGFLTQI